MPRSESKDSETVKIAKPRGTKTPAWANRTVLFSAVALLLIIGGTLLTFLPGPLATHWSAGASDSGGGNEIPTSPAAAAQIIILSLGGIVGAIGVALSLSRHGEELEAAQRDRDRLLEDRAREETRKIELSKQIAFEIAKEEDRRSENARQMEFAADSERRSRFVTLAQLLSDTEHPTNRIAALHSLGALADDWSRANRNDEVQVCIDVLTEYLRTPPSPNSEGTAPDEIPVKIAGFSVIREHLQGESKYSWSDFRITLSGGHFDYPVDLSFSEFRSSLDLSRITVTDDGSIWLGFAEFSKGGTLSMLGSKLIGHNPVDLAYAELSGTSKISFSMADISSSHSDEFSITLDLSKITLRDSSSIDLSGLSASESGSIGLTSANLLDQSTIELDFTRFSDNSTIDFSEATMVAESGINLQGLRLSDGSKLRLPGVVAGAESIEIKAPAELSRSGNITLPDGRKIAIRGVGDQT